MSSVGSAGEVLYVTLSKSNENYGAIALLVEISVCVCLLLNLTHSLLDGLALTSVICKCKTHMSWEPFI